MAMINLNVCQLRTHMLRAPFKGPDNRKYHVIFKCLFKIFTRHIHKYYLSHFFPIHSYFVFDVR